MYFDKYSYLSDSRKQDFFDYWESLGFFDNIEFILPSQFLILFEIARVIFTPEKENQAKKAVDDILKKEKMRTFDREKSIMVNRMEKPAPISNTMDIDRYRTIYDLKKALPRELVWEPQIFDTKLFTKTLQVQRFYEQESDQIKKVSTVLDRDGNAIFKFEQKFYLLLDRSGSMDMYTRSFYSKCIVAEFLKRKYQSNAKIYFRPFDSETGELFITEKKSDFPALIEKVLLTTTGGTGTNMQKAIIQAVNDINYDKEALDAEILVVTDGVIDDLNKDKLVTTLKDIKLNILKIGRDLAEPNYFEMKKMLSGKGFDFDPQTVNLNDIRKKKNNPDPSPDDVKLSAAEERIYDYMLGCSASITKNLMEVASKFIEIDDLKKSELFILDDETIYFIEKSVRDFRNADITAMDLHDRTVLYKKVNFLYQYIQFLLESSGKKNDSLSNAIKELFTIKERLLGDPNLFKIIMRIPGFEENKKFIKNAKKGVREKKKEMRRQAKLPTKIDIRKAKLILAMDVGGEGNIWLLIKLIFINIWLFIKRALKFLKKLKGRLQRRYGLKKAPSKSD